MQPRFETETTTPIIRKALCDVNTVFGSVRIDKASGKASSIDVIRLVLRSDSSTANTTLRRLLAVDDCTPSMKSRIKYLRINGCGKITPVADLRTLIEIVWKLPGRTSTAFRWKSAETVCRVMGGDLNLLREILSEDRMVLESLPDQKSKMSCPSQSEGLNHALLFEADAL